MIDFTEEELADIGAALDNAGVQIAAELKLARARPYERVLKDQQKRYEKLYAKVVRAVEGK